MDRILILMAAHEYVDASNAIASARQNAANPGALTFGFTLQEYPQEESFDALEAMGAVPVLPQMLSDIRKLPVFQGSLFD